VVEVYEFHPAMTLCRPFALRDESLIPPREWLYGRWCIRGFVSTLLARGGTGKTSVYISECLALATGRNLLGVQPAEAVPVWILNLEDPADEMERRLAAAAARHGVTNEMLGHRLFVDGSPQAPMILLQRDRDGVAIDYAAVQTIVDRIERHRIGLLVVDPFVASHALNENDNGEMNAAVSVWRSIAARTNCAVLLVHHLAKGRPTDDATDEGGRGAGAVRDGARTSRLVRAMTVEEAEEFGLTNGERRSYILVSDAKNNMAEIGVGDWLRLTSIRLANGDAVAAVETWKPPGPLDGVEADDLDAVVAWLAANGPQRAHPSSPDWFGWRAAEICRVQSQTREARARAARILKALTEQGRIRITATEAGRKGRPAYEAVA
jgi:hypothetical protein